MFGLTEKDIIEIVDCLRHFPEVEMAFVFGSRAKGNYKKGSDIDLALKGRKINFSTISRINGLLNEDTLMPYHFDIINYHKIERKELVAHVDRVGILLYRKEGAQVTGEPEIKYKTVIKKKE